ncbi:hypothetical protein HYH03_007335 [Edaphochlamys debaryana]|uniref:Uncharacterized protein n=1 Tax=Edaphochlamys debaryana TaxID=47281 RepID=A0A835YBM8_9CHLO|nr:hypothetical protein HYH03_007335 [Edaphochlamys debaryana]|eukprot:KAG2494569.1 hypothetical protein HYH03_007335 [Edaphochlamys debaryana]
MCTLRFALNRGSAAGAAGRGAPAGSAATVPSSACAPVTTHATNIFVDGTFEDLEGQEAVDGEFGFLPSRDGRRTASCGGSGEVHGRRPSPSSWRALLRTTSRFDPANAAAANGPENPPASSPPAATDTPAAPVPSPFASAEAFTDASAGDVTDEYGNRLGGWYGMERHENGKLTLPLFFTSDEGEAMVCEDECLAELVRALEEDHARPDADDMSFEGGRSAFLFSPPSRLNLGAANTAADDNPAVGGDAAPCFAGPSLGAQAASPPSPAGMGPRELPLTPSFSSQGGGAVLDGGPAAPGDSPALRSKLAHLSRVGRITARRLHSAAVEALSDHSANPAGLASAAASVISALPNNGGLGTALWAAAGVGSMFAAAKRKLTGGETDAEAPAAEAEELGAEVKKEGFGCKVAAVLADAIVGGPSPSAKLAVRRRMRAFIAGASLAWTAVNLATACVALAGLDLSADVITSTHTLLDLACNLPDVGEVARELVHVGLAAGVAASGGGGGSVPLCSMDSV